MKGYVRTTLDKLVHLRSHLVQFDDDWKNWEFGDLVESLRKWTDRNPALQSAETHKTFEKRREPNLQTVDQRENSGRANQQRKCVYCESTEHKAADCTDAATIEERKQILTAKDLCFNINHEIAAAKVRANIAKVSITLLFARKDLKQKKNQ